MAQSTQKIEQLKKIKLDFENMLLPLEIIAVKNLDSINTENTRK